MTVPKNDPAVRAFRDTLGMFPTGVTVITARAPGGEPIGLTVSSFNSVSLTPPLIVTQAQMDQALDILDACLAEESLP